MGKLKKNVENLASKITGKEVKADSLSEALGKFVNEVPGELASKDYVDTKATAVYRYKGSVATYSLLPLVGNQVGDVYNVLDTGDNYAWDGTIWDKLAGLTYLAVADITALTTEQINGLRAGDIVVKKTGDQRHSYRVSYKEENVGICLTYVDASISETVSYDYSNGAWVYNSTDVTELGGGIDVVEITDTMTIEELSHILASGNGSFIKRGNDLYLAYACYDDMHSKYMLMLHRFVSDITQQRINVEYLLFNTLVATDLVKDKIRNWYMANERLQAFLPKFPGQPNKYLKIDSFNRIVWGDAPVVDQTYNASSQNAQSGVAVAQAISGAITTALNTAV